MDGENNGKPYFLMDDLGYHYFRKHPNVGSGHFNRGAKKKQNPVKG